MMVYKTLGRDVIQNQDKGGTNPKKDYPVGEIEVGIEWRIERSDDWNWWTNIFWVDKLMKEKEVTWGKVGTMTCNFSLRLMITEAQKCELEEFWGLIVKRQCMLGKMVNSNPKEMMEECIVKKETEEASEWWLATSGCD